MKKTMTVFGAGHKIAAVTVPFLGITLAAGYLRHELFTFGALPASLLIGTGCGLIVLGLAVNFTAAVMMMRAFAAKRLQTSGPYAISRNPMYTSFLLLTLPGMALVLNNWTILGVTAAVYAATTRFVREEERWLEEQFGAEWIEYTSRVGRILPRLF